MQPGFLDYLVSGQYLPAVGLALIAIVGFARMNLAKVWPWFATQAGGYVLGYGAATLLYVGSALASGSGLSVGLFSCAVAAGWTAAGGFEHFRDAINALRGKAPPGPAIAGAVLLVALAVGCSSCHEGKGEPGPGAIIVDCTKAEQHQLAAIVLAMSPLLAAESPDWDAVEQMAIGAGGDIGGCALAELVQRYMTARRVPLDEGWKAHFTLEHFRAQYANGATFHTASGDL